MLTPFQTHTHTHTFTHTHTHTCRVVHMYAGNRNWGRRIHGMPRKMHEPEIHPPPSSLEDGWGGVWGGSNNTSYLSSMPTLSGTATPALEWSSGVICYGRTPRGGGGGVGKWALFHILPPDLPFAEVHWNLRVEVVLSPRLKSKDMHIGVRFKWLWPWVCQWMVGFLCWLC